MHRSKSLPKETFSRFNHLTLTVFSSVSSIVKKVNILNTVKKVNNLNIVKKVNNLNTVNGGCLVMAKREGNELEPSHEFLTRALQMLSSISSEPVTEGPARYFLAVRP